MYPFIVLYGSPEGKRKIVYMRLYPPSEALRIACVGSQCCRALRSANTEGEDGHPLPQTVVLQHDTPDVDLLGGGSSQVSTLISAANSWLAHAVSTALVTSYGRAPKKALLPKNLSISSSVDLHAARLWGGRSAKNSCHT